MRAIELHYDKKTNQTWITFDGHEAVAGWSHGATDVAERFMTEYGFDVKKEMTRILVERLNKQFNLTADEETYVREQIWNEL